MKFEREVFGQLLESGQARAQQYAFFAERAVTRVSHMVLIDWLNVVLILLKNISLISEYHHSWWWELSKHLCLHGIKEGRFYRVPLIYRYCGVIIVHGGSMFIDFLGTCKPYSQEFNSSWAFNEVMNYLALQCNKTSFPRNCVSTNQQRFVNPQNIGPHELEWFHSMWFWGTSGGIFNAHCLQWHGMSVFTVSSLWKMKNTENLSQSFFVIMYWDSWYVTKKGWFAWSFY